MAQGQSTVPPAAGHPRLPQRAGSLLQHEHPPRKHVPKSRARGRARGLRTGHANDGSARRRGDNARRAAAPTPRLLGRAGFVYWVTYLGGALPLVLIAGGSVAPGAIGTLRSRAQVRRAPPGGGGETG